MIIDQGWKIIIIFLKTFFHHKKKQIIPFLICSENYTIRTK